MRRKSLWLIGTLLLVGGLLGTGAALLRHEPEFYRAKGVPEGESRTQHSKAFEGKVWQLGGSIAGEQDSWQGTFTEAQINSYFAEDFVQSGAAAKMLPASVCEPRVAIDRDLIRLGFRYGHGLWSTVISLDFKAWMVPKESNAVALEFRSLRAGAVPISSTTLIRQLAEFTERLNSERTSLEVTWYRHEGHPVALLRFAGASARPTTQLRQLKIGQGVLTVAGRSVPAPTQVFAPPSPPPAREAAVNVGVVPSAN